MIKKILKTKPSIQLLVSFIPLTILILYFITRLTLSHNNIIFLTISFTLNLITTIIITFSSITAYIKFKTNKNNYYKMLFWSTLMILHQASALFSETHTLFEKSSVFIADIFAIIQIIYLIKENKKKGTNSNV